MRRTALALLLALSALGIAQDTTLDFTPSGFLFEYDGAVGPLKVAEIKREIEVIEWQEGMHVRKRAGKVKPMRITCERSWSSDSSAFDILVNKVLHGVTDRKSGSIVYLDREGNEVLRQSFGNFGDVVVTFPGTGNQASNDGVRVSGLSYLHKEGIVHRDIAARASVKPGKAVVRMSESTGIRDLVCGETSHFRVVCDTGDLDGDGAPDVTEFIAASDMSMVLGASELAMLEEWQKATDFAASLELPYNRHLSILWPLADGGAYEVSMMATLKSFVAGVKGTYKVDVSLEQVQPRLITR